MAAEVGVTATMVALCKVETIDKLYGAYYVIKIIMLSPMTSCLCFVLWIIIDLPASAKFAFLSLAHIDRSC